MPASVDLGRVVLTKQQMRALEIELFRAADLIDRLMVDKIQYTKMEVPAPPQMPQGMPGANAGIPPPVPVTPAATMAPFMSNRLPQGGQ